MPVGEMLGRMTSAEYACWIALDHIEYIGDLRSDYQAAVVASTMVNMWRGKGQKPISPIQFMPFADKPKSKKKEDTLRPYLTMLAKGSKRGKRR